MLAASPVLSATTLAHILGIAVKNAIHILDTLMAAEIAVEVTHRSKRRLFGLQGLTPLRDVVQPPYRPEPGRGRGRPPILSVDDDVAEPLPPLTPVERRAFDYTALEEAMAHLDAVVRASRVALHAIADGTHDSRANASPNGAEVAPACQFPPMMESLPMPETYRALLAALGRALASAMPAKERPLTRPFVPIRP